LALPFSYYSIRPRVNLNILIKIIKKKVVNSQVKFNLRDYTLNILIFKNKDIVQHFYNNKNIYLNESLRF